MGWLVVLQLRRPWSLAAYVSLVLNLALLILWPDRRLIACSSICGPSNAQ